MCSSNNNTSANEQVTEGLETESKAGILTAIPTQHSAISLGQAGITTPRVITDPNETSNPTPRRNSRRRQNNSNNSNNITNATNSVNSDIIPGTNINVNDLITKDQFNTMLTMIQTLSNQINTINNTISNQTNNQTMGEIDNSLENEESEPTSDNSTTSNTLPQIPYWKINASNYQNFNIDWNKFDSFTYATKRHQSKLIKDTIEHIPMPPIKYNNPKDTDPIAVLTWYHQFEESMAYVGLETFLFKKDFNQTTANAVEIVEDRYIRKNVLARLFPRDSENLINATSSTAFFKAIQTKYLPKRPIELANNMLAQLEVTYDCDLSRLDTTYTIINMLRKRGEEEKLAESTYVSVIMTKALDNFTELFSTIYDDWKHNKANYSLAYTLQVINDHIDETPERIRDSVPPTTRAYEINNVDYKNRNFNQGRFTLSQQNKYYKQDNRYNQGNRYNQHNNKRFRKPQQRNGYKHGQYKKRYSKQE